MNVKVCYFDELKEREPYTVAVDGIEVGIIKWDDQLYAYENTCAHIGGPVCLGGVFNKVNLILNEDKTVVKECIAEDELRLVCPWHGFEYDLKTGECDFSAKFKLRKFYAFVKNNEVYVEI
ncbi:Rieske (2Fe-2S) protein [Bacillus sp. FJAT-29814]|uniref:Rieske (2Fe-2S) protein n=1 Tax=Bacillus sp. FJAT-29814 TaxID=1729688 RepID=UPI00082E6FAE|nr:Rieske (2Fe-2S) protein [Bacillus sp. FJAT-29814]